MIGLAVLNTCFFYVKPPISLPDLWTVLICIYCCIHFVGFSVLFHLIQFSLNTTMTSNKKELNFQSCLSQTIVRQKHE